MIKLFISQPMHGLSDEEIKFERDRVVDKFRSALGVQYPNVDNEVEVVNVIDPQNAPKDASRLWYLTEAIRTMEIADVIIFMRGWDKASGCRVERAVVENYQSMFADRLILTEGVTGWYYIGKDTMKRLGISPSDVPIDGGALAWT